MPYVMGIDFGSMTGKAVILDENENIVGSSVVQKGAVSEEGVFQAVDNALEQAGLTQKDIARSVSTGYGRRLLEVANRTITEITCHAKGSHFLFPECRTVIDIGGQDSKVILVDELGFVQQFAMNDRCAAGTGQFLDSLARVMELDIDEIGALSLQSTEEVAISSMCTVFAETEVISLLASGKTKADILAGVHDATTRRVVGMCQRVGVRPPVAMTGGVSRNIGIVEALEKNLDLPVQVSEHSQTAGALGAALFALEDAMGVETISSREAAPKEAGSPQDRRPEAMAASRKDNA